MKLVKYTVIDDCLFCGNEIEKSRVKVGLSTCFTCAGKTAKKMGMIAEDGEISIMSRFSYKNYSYSGAVKETE